MEKEVSTSIKMQEILSGGHFFATATDPWSLGPTYNASAVGEERVATGLGLRAMGGKATETLIMSAFFLLSEPSLNC